MQQDTKKNYIGVVSDTAEEERFADSTARLQPRLVSDLVGRLAAMLKRPRKGAS